MENYKAYPYSRWIKWGVIALVAVILAGVMISTYNGVSKEDQKVKSKWSQVQNQMQRRADTIINLVETVKGFAKLEEKVISDVTNARKVLYSGNADIASKLQADTVVANTARSIVENYPQLKSSEQFTNLMTAIEGSENRVAVARKDFIDATESYNNKVIKFPTNIISKILGYSTKDYFEATPDAQEAPKVKF